MAGAVERRSPTMKATRPITDEAIIAAKPDVVLTIERGGPNPVGARSCSRFRLSARRRPLQRAISSRWMGFTCSASARAPRVRPAILTLKLYPELAGSVTDTAAKTMSGLTSNAAPAVPRRSWARSTQGRLTIIVLRAGVAGGRRDRRGRDRRRRHSAVAAAGRAWASLHGADDAALVARDQLVLWSVRLPRIAMAIIIGALLAASGAIMQGLFRNPLADPALVGVSSGGALAAATDHRDRRPAARVGKIVLPFELLPVAAFVGSLVTTLVAASHRHAREPHLDCDLPARRHRDRRAGQRRHRPAGVRRRRPAVARHHVLAARLARRRDLGEGRSSRCRSLLAMLPAFPFIARGLDLLVLGEAEAFHMGVEVERLKRDRHRAGLGHDRRRRRLRRRDRLCRHCRAASCSGSSSARGHRLAAAGVGLAGAVMLLIADTFARTHRRARGSADRHSHARWSARRSSSPSCCGNARWSDYDAVARSARLSVHVGREGAGRQRLVCDRAGRKRRPGRAERRGQIDPAARSVGRTHAEPRARVCIQGRDPRAYRPRELAQHRALLSQHITVAFPFSVAEVVRMGAGDDSGRALESMVEQALAEVDLAEFRRRIIGTLSGGEQQRVHFARVLVQLRCGEAATAPASCCSTSRPPASTSAISSICSQWSGIALRPAPRSW